MKAILIDPKEGNINFIDISGDDPMQDLYNTIGCDLVERVQLPNGDDVWLDEEGWINYKGNGGFVLDQYPTMPLAGKAVVLGQSGEFDEDFGDCVSNVEGLGESVKFLSDYYAQHIANKFG